MKFKWPTVLLGTPSFVRAAELPLRCTVDPEAYHRPGTAPEDAERLCEGCPYLLACRVYGLRHVELSGVWGGTTQGERERLRRAAGAAA